MEVPKRPEFMIERITSFGVNNYISIVVFTLISYIFYQQYIHPLAKFPGPFLASLTNLWRVYHFNSGKQHFNDSSLHKRYGPVFRDGPNSLSFSDPRALEPIYGHKTCLSKSDWYMIFAPDLSGIDFNVFTSRPAEQHKRLRKRVAGSYSMSSAMGYEQTIDSNIIAWTQKIKELKTVAFEKWAYYLTLDTMSEIGFGERLGFVENGGDINGQCAALRSAFIYMNILAFLPSITRILKSNWVKALQPYLDLSIIRKKSTNEISPIEQIIGFSMNIIKDRQLNGNTVGKPHMVVSLLGLKNPDGSPLSESELVGESTATIVAGSDTTSYAIQIILYHILRHPTVYERLVTELKDASSKGNLKSPVVTYTQTTELPYLNAVVTEVMRLHPSFGGNFYRSVGEGGLEILPGVFVPGETSVSVNAYISHRDKATFGEDAEEFKPERWLPWDSEEVVRMKKYLSTFGYGARICLGRYIALVDINKTIVEMIRRFEMKLVNPEIPLKESNAAQMIISDLYIEFLERKESL